MVLGGRNMYLGTKTRVYVDAKNYQPKLYFFAPKNKIELNPRGNFLETLFFIKVL